MAVRRPAEAFRPGEFVHDELDARGWTQTDLAAIVGRPFALVNGIITGRRGITPETALGLAAAFGTSPEFWLNLQAAYQLWRVGAPEQDEVSRRAKLYSLAPINHMLSRGWLEPSESLDVLEAQVLRFFEIPSLDATPRFAVAARKSTAYDEDHTPAQRAWLFRAKRLANGVQVKPFSRPAVQEVLARLATLTHEPEEARHVPRLLADAGVRFLVVQPLPGSKIDGACFWLDDTSPVVALSLRFDRIDNFWFCLMHELAHVVSGDGSVDDDLVASTDATGRPRFEQEADRTAANTLVSKENLDGFIARNRPTYSAVKVRGFALTNGVHPGIVVGQLQHRREIGWANFRNLLTPIREFVVAMAPTDGWGNALPAAV